LRFSDALAADQSRFARARPTRNPLSAVRKARDIWQRRFWEHLIRDDADDARYVEYINPLKHGLVERVRDWPQSSFRRDVGARAFPVDRGGDIEVIGEFGERWDR